MNDNVALGLLFRLALLLHALTFFIFDSFIGPIIAFSLAMLSLFPRLIGKFVQKISFLFPLLGKGVATIILTPFYFVLLTPLSLLQKKRGKKKSSTLISCEREITSDFFHRQW